MPAGGNKILTRVVARFLERDLDCKHRAKGVGRLGFEALFFMCTKAQNRRIMRYRANTSKFSLVVSLFFLLSNVWLGKVVIFARYTIFRRNKSLDGSGKIFAFGEMQRA